MGPEAGHCHYVRLRLTDEALVCTDLYRSMILPSGPANTICPVEGNVICASHLAYLVNLNLKESSNPYHASTNTVHTIFSKPTQHQDQREFLTVAEIDHSISVFKEDSPTLIGSLRTENEVLAADIWWIGHHPKNSSQDLTNRMAQPEYALAAVNKDGTLEIFPEPFGFPAASSGKNAESLKARMKHRSRPSAAQVKIVRAEKETEQVPLIGASFQGNQIILAWVEGGLNVIFDTIRWRDEETSILLLKDATEIVKRKSGAGLGAVSMNGAKDMGRSHVDDSHAVVANGADVDDVSMDEVGQQVIDISSAEEEGASEGGQPVARLSGSREDVEDEGKDEDGDNLADEEDEDMEDAGSRDGSPEQEVGSPSFGDLIRASASDPIDVPHNLPDDHPQSLVPANSTSVQPLSSGLSLGTVLTQSLRTNDTNLLETCFHTQDLPTVRATIERLDSSFATILLQRLAERLHSRPGRAGSLMVWVQWTLVAHGGYLAGQPEMMRRLRNLHKVVKERAGSLQSLLNLKGKLDMLEAQMNLRRSVLERGRGANAEEEDDEDAVIYVEGQEEDDSSDEDELDNQGGGSDDDDEHTDAFSSRASQTRLSKDTDVQRNQVEANGDEDDDMPPTTTGPPIDSEAASDSDEDGMIDDEASETDNASSDELDDEDIDHDSIDISSSDEEAPPPPPPDKKRAKGTGKLSNGIGPRGH